MRKQNSNKSESLWPDLAIGLTGLAIASLLGLLCSGCSPQEPEKLDVAAAFGLLCLAAVWLALVPLFVKVFDQLVEDLIADGALPNWWKDYTHTLGVFWPVGIAIFIGIMLAEGWK